MAIRIRLQDGSELLVQATLDQLHHAFRKALAKNEVLEVEDPDGNVIAVNPQQIQYFREDPEAAGDLAEQFPEPALAH
jgi:hypothetical protein